jgi:gliding motility-associated-like protein
LEVLQSCNTQTINVDNGYYELTYGDNPFDITVIASSGLLLIFSTSGTSVDVQNTNVPAGLYRISIQSTGTTVITFNQAGNNYYAPVEKTVTIEVNPAELTVKAKDYTVDAGAAFPLLGCTYSGFVYGEDSTVLINLPTISCAVANTNVAGEYPLTVSGAEADNYIIKYINGILKIKGSVGKLSNAFTPNQDGHNDIFGEGYELYIFNRWGSCLYKDFTGKGWNGKYKGKMLPSGAYYYYAKDSKGNTYKGSVMLVTNR